MAYISRRQLEAFGEPIGDMSIRGADNRATYHGGGKDDGGDAPDYTPMAQASEASARIGAELGREQLAEGKRQYDQNMAVATPIVQAQTGLMNQAITQGDDYYNYMKGTYRPVEQNLAMEAMGLNADEMGQVYGLQSQEQQAANNAMAQARQQYQDYVTKYTAGNKFDTSQFADVAVPTAQIDYNGDGVYNSNDKPNPMDDWFAKRFGITNQYTSLNQKDIDAATLQNKINANLRSALGSQTSSAGAMGFDAFSAGLGTADNSGSTSLMQRLSTGALDRNAELKANAAMADARQGTTAMQNQLARQGLRYGWSPAKMAAMAGSAANTQGLGVASAANTAREKEKLVQYGKKMDVAGLGKGLAGASQGAYGLANQSGNSAVGNQMQPGNQYLGYMNGGNGTVMQGMGQQVQGLGSILGAQTSYANQNQGGGGLGALLGVAGQLGSAYMMMPAS